MTFKISFAAALLAAGVTLLAAPGIAATSGSLAPLKALGSAQLSNVQETGWLSGRCHWGLGGYHKWVPGVGRVQCTAKKCWTNRFGIRRCRWF